MRKALYRKYRPASFDDVVGQDHITSVLSWQCENGNTSHAYLFCGSRGTGKTTCAKILAKAVNCSSPINGSPCGSCESCVAIDSGRSMLVYEMDAASNTGVDYVREIRDEIIFTPATEGVKVYIIDEVHMLSEGAFNALLKTLEEPPSKVMFILATTEMRKVPATILSRCQRFDFRRITNSKIAQRLKYISDNENIALDDAAAELIARISQGGMRDAISMLELCASERERVDVDTVRETAGVFGRETASAAVLAIAEKNCEKILDIVSDVYTSSKDIAVFMSEIISFYRDMTVQKSLSVKTLSETSLFDLTENEFEEVRSLASRFSYEKLIYHYKLLSEAYSEIVRTESKRTTAEITLLKLASDRSELSIESLAARVAELEKKLARMPRDSGTAQEVAPPREKNNRLKLETQDEKQSEKSDSVSVGDKKDDFKEDGNVKLSRSLWNRIVEKFINAEPSMAHFLRESKALSHNSELIIEVKGSFVKTMLESVKAKQIVMGIIREENCGFDDVSIRVAAEVPKEASLIDELM